MNHIFLLAFLLNSSLNATLINGSGSLKNQNINQDFLINGAGSIEGTEIKGQLKINGSLSVKHSKLNDLTVNGSFYGESVIITGKTMIQGDLAAKNSTFENITVTSESATLEDCKAEEITIKAIPEKEQIIEIKGASQIQKITFESKRGVIKKSQQSKINETFGVK